MLNSRSWLKIFGLVLLTPITFNRSVAASDWDSISDKGCNYRLLSVRPGDTTKKQALGVDTDGRIVLLTLDGDRKVSTVTPLGYAQIAPAEFDAHRLIPREEALLALRRLSDHSGRWKLWVALTVGFERVDQERRAAYRSYNFVRVFRDAGNGPRLQTTRSFPDVTELLVEDVNGDGMTEIAVQYLEQSPMSPSTWLSMYQVDESGHLHVVSLDSVEKDLDLGLARKTELELGDYKHGDKGLYSRQETVSEAGVLTLQKHYDWNIAKHEYVLVDVSKTLETVLK